jgi:hypothetical protein
MHILHPYGVKHDEKKTIDARDDDFIYVLKWLYVVGYRF